MLALDAVRYRYPGAAQDAVDGVSLAVAGGEFVAVVGPNGSGKTTLLRLALGVLRPQAGAVTAFGRPVESYSRRALARLAAVVAQREEMVFPLRVRDAVMLGRYPHLPALGAPGAADRAAVARALERCDATGLAERWVAALSGGEYQRVRLARALAQEPRLLVLDEPTASLDLRHEMELFERVRSLVERQALGALVVTHHVNLAARFADRLLLLDGGRPAASGAPPDVLTRAVVERVFGWPVAVEPFDGRPQMIPLRRPTHTEET